MNISSSRDVPDPFVPACLTSAPSQYDPQMCLEPELYDLYPDPEATEKRAVVKREEVEV